MQNAVGIISNLRQGIRSKEGFEWILVMMLCFQEIEYLIKHCLDSQHFLILSFKVCLHNCLPGCCELDQRTRPAFKSSNFCFMESRNNHRILPLLCCWYMAYIRKCPPENYWGLCTSAQNSARPEQGSKLLSLQTLRSGWTSAEISWGLQTRQGSQRDAVGPLCDSLMVSSFTQQVGGQIHGFASAQEESGPRKSLSHLSRRL